MTPEHPVPGHTPDDLTAGGSLPAGMAPEGILPEDIDDADAGDGANGSSARAASSFRFVVPEELAGTRVDAGWRNSWAFPARRPPR